MLLPVCLTVILHVGIVVIVTVVVVVDLLMLGVVRDDTFGTTNTIGITHTFLNQQIGMIQYFASGFQTRLRPG